MEWTKFGAEITEQNGVFSAAVNNTLFPTKEQTAMFSVEKTPLNFALECEIKLKKDGEAGVYFRSQGKNGARWVVGYYLILNAADQSLTLKKVNGGDSDHVVLSHMCYPFTKDVWYKIRIEVRGTYAKIWFNNFAHETAPIYPKIDLELKHFTRGGIGFNFGEDVAEFRDIAMTEIEGAKPYDPDKQYLNPVVYGADPDIMYYDGTYYLYFTDTQDMSLFQCYTSKDLIHWSEPHVVFHGCDGWGNNEYMSPNVIYKDGLFYMFYASHTAPNPKTGRREPHVAFATSTSPLGPFKSKTMKPIHEDVLEIGGHPFIDEDGRSYLTVVRFNNGNEIWAYEIKMEDGIVTALDDTLVKIMVPTEPWECDYARITEGGVIFKHKGLYYMIYAGSHYKGDYGEGFAIAEKPLGPYVKYKYNPILRGTKFSRGTGDSVYTRTPNGDYIMFYHQHFSPVEISPRHICYDAMKFVEVDGEPDVILVKGPTTTPQDCLIK